MFFKEVAQNRLCFPTRCTAMELPSPFW